MLLHNEEKRLEKELIDQLGHRHVIVDKKDWLIVQDYITIIDEILYYKKKEDIPLLIGLSPALDIKIHKILRK